MTTMIGGHRFHLQDPLGAGSFGEVWGALSDHGVSTAIKDITCKSASALVEAEHEGRILHLLAKSGVSQVPALLAAQSFQIGPSTWKVRIAMQRLPDGALDKFCENQKSNTARCVADPEGGFSEACL